MIFFICLGFFFFFVQDDIYEILIYRYMYQINSYLRDIIEIDLYSEGNFKLLFIGICVWRVFNWLYNGQDFNMCGIVVGYNYRGEYFVLIVVIKIILILVFKEFFNDIV